ncbi:MAG: hypothetical protein U0L34_00755, partial [Paludibacteraceae bacterium]|nr:hypothetical protein [Paludibacteraceae bacterium]
MSKHILLTVIWFCCLLSPTMAAKQTTERLFYTTEFDSLFMQGLCHLHADSLTLAQESFKKCQKLESKSAVVAYQLANI